MSRSWSRRGSPPSTARSRKLRSISARKPLKVFLVITLPLIAPALAAGWLLAFTLSLDDLVIASFTSGPSSTTLPMVIFSSVRLGVSPQINALATLFLVAVAVLVTVAGRLIEPQRHDGSRRRCRPGAAGAIQLVLDHRGEGHVEALAAVEEARAR